MFLFKRKNTSISSSQNNISTKSDKNKIIIKKNMFTEDPNRPYSLYYDLLFKEHKDKSLNIAIIGSSDNPQSFTWKEHFVNSKIDLFENNLESTNYYKNKNKLKKIPIIKNIDIRKESHIKKALDTKNKDYDLMVLSSSKQIKDHKRFIKSSLEHLAPGGMLIIENLYKEYDENSYIMRLSSALDSFRSYYFVSINHLKDEPLEMNKGNRLFILLKNGEPILKNKKKMTIITPSIKPQNLMRIKESIDFDYIDEWIIVYDGSKIDKNPLVFKNENNPKIKEYIFTGIGFSGNPQRNYGLDNIKIKDTYIFFLDDDNEMNPNIYQLLDIKVDGIIYTFDQHKGLKGNNIKVERIDTAMYLIDFSVCKDNRWISEKWMADGYYIEECYSENKDRWIYVNNRLCYYNSKK